MSHTGRQGYSRRTHTDVGISTTHRDKLRRSTYLGSSRRQDIRAGIRYRSKTPPRPRGMHSSGSSPEPSETKRRHPSFKRAKSPSQKTARANASVQTDSKQSTKIISLQSKAVTLDSCTQTPIRGDDSLEAQMLYGKENLTEASVNTCCGCYAVRQQAQLLTAKMAFTQLAAKQREAGSSKMSLSDRFLLLDAVPKHREVSRVAVIERPKTPTKTALVTPTRHKPIERKASADDNKTITDATNKLTARVSPGKRQSEPITEESTSSKQRKLGVVTLLESDIARSSAHGRWASKPGTGDARIISLSETRQEVKEQLEAQPPSREDESQNVPSIRPSKSSAPHTETPNKHDKCTGMRTAQLQKNPNRSRSTMKVRPASSRQCEDVKRISTAVHSQPKGTSTATTTTTTATTAPVLDILSLQQKLAQVMGKLLKSRGGEKKGPAVAESHLIETGERLVRAAQSRHGNVRKQVVGKAQDKTNQVSTGANKAADPSTIHNSNENAVPQQEVGKNVLEKTKSVETVHLPNNPGHGKEVTADKTRAVGKKWLPIPRAVQLEPKEPLQKGATIKDDIAHKVSLKLSGSCRGSVNTRDHLSDDQSKSIPNFQSFSQYRKESVKYHLSPPSTMISTHQNTSDVVAAILTSATISKNLIPLDTAKPLYRPKLLTATMAFEQNCDMQSAIATRIPSLIETSRDLETVFGCKAVPQLIAVQGERTMVEVELQGSSIHSVELVKPVAKEESENSTVEKSITKPSDKASPKTKSTSNSQTNENPITVVSNQNVSRNQPAKTVANGAANPTAGQKSAQLNSAQTATTQQPQSQVQSSKTVINDQKGSSEPATTNSSSTVVTAAVQSAKPENQPTSTETSPSQTETQPTNTAGSKELKAGTSTPATTIAKSTDTKQMESLSVPTRQHALPGFITCNNRHRCADDIMRFLRRHNLGLGNEFVNGCMKLTNARLFLEGNYSHPYLIKDFHTGTPVLLNQLARLIVTDQLHDEVEKYLIDKLGVPHHDWWNYRCDAVRLCKYTPPTIGYKLW